MYGSPLGKRWPGIGELVDDLGAFHNLAGLLLGKILLNTTGNGSLTRAPSTPPLAGEDSDGVMLECVMHFGPAVISWSHELQSPS